MSKYNFNFDINDNNTLSWIANSIEANTEVLEFGPANGRLTKYLCEQKNCTVDIVEIDEEAGIEAANYARKALLGNEQGDIEKYYWINNQNKYRYIIFADVLEHLRHPEIVLKRCNSIIEDNGKILVSLPNISHNSIIISLINDKFNYGPIGILDNTHLKFFTRGSFGEMALGAGWVIASEKANHIRVGENEIKFDYQCVSREVAKELRNRAQGDIYQYYFELVKKEQYLLGEYQHYVSLDCSSYYWSEICFMSNNGFSFANAVLKHFNPHEGKIDWDIVSDYCEGYVLIRPVNTNIVINNISIRCINERGEWENLEIEDSNAFFCAGVYYFIDENPEIKVKGFYGGTMRFQANILSYDFEPLVMAQLVEALKYEQNHIGEVCNTYEKYIKSLNQHLDECNQASNEYQKKIEDYQEEIEDYQEKNKQFQIQTKELLHRIDSISVISENEKKAIMSTYEEEIQRREAERLILLSNQKRSMFGIVKNWIKKILRLYRKITHHEKRVVINSVNNTLEKVPVTRKVSVVIPNYNYAKYLKERVDSILLQTYPVAEIYIIDDCSTDNSISVIENIIEDNKTEIPINLIINEHNSGSVFSQWQKAFEIAQNDYVWIAEADDSCNEKFLETVMRGFDDPEVIISYCESLTMNESNELLMGDLRVWIDIFNTGKWDNNYINSGVDEVAQSMCINNTIANVSSAIIRNGDYHNILEEAKQYKLAGDWYTYMNLLKRGKIAYFRDSLNYHRMQKQGLTLSTTHEKEYEEIVRLQEFAIKNFDISPDIKKKIYERRERERIRFGL